MIVNLIHPPHPNSTDDRLDPPLGLLYLATHLRDNGVGVSLSDLSGMKQKDWKIPFADIYGITVYITSIKVTKEIIKECKKVNPNAIIVVGGAHPSARPNDFSFVDHVVVGPGEVAIVDIALGKEKGHIVIGKEPKDYFVFPAYDLIDINSYHRTIGHKRSLPYLTSRGCPYKCAFCGLSTMHKLGAGVKIADASIVKIHLEIIKNILKVNSISFQDDIFTMNKARLYSILETTKEHHINFRCMGRAGLDTEEVYKKLAESGCEQLSWGIESGSQRILDKMNKRVKVGDNYSVIQWAKKYGITTRAFFIIGFPGETEQTIRETKQFIIDADPDQYFASNFVPYPGTDCGDNPSKYGITRVSEDFNNYYQVNKEGMGGITIDTEWLSRENFRKVELDFRNWLKNRPFRGNTQQYEDKLAGNKKH